MRIFVAVLGVLATLITASAAVADQPPQVTLTVEASEPRADPEDTGNALGRRAWDVDFHVTVSADRMCDRLGYAYRSRDLFNGSLGLNRPYASEDTTSEPAQRADFGITSVSGIAGDTLFLTATASCVVGGQSFASRAMQFRIPIPPRSCEQGPLRVLGLAGGAWREDMNVSNKPFPLYAGNYLWSAYTAWLGQGGRIRFGAPECNGFTISLRGGHEFFPGSYARRGRGNTTGIGRGALAVFVGDQHAGGIETENALITPRGGSVASFEVLSYPQSAGRLTRVRVFRGAVRVRSGPGGGAMSPPMLVGAGYVTTVRCSSYRHCVPDPPRN